MYTQSFMKKSLCCSEEKTQRHENSTTHFSLNTYTKSKEVFYCSASSIHVQAATAVNYRPSSIDLFLLMIFLLNFTLFICVWSGLQPLLESDQTTQNLTPLQPSCCFQKAIHHRQDALSVTDCTSLFSETLTNPDYLCM